MNKPSALLMLQKWWLLGLVFLIPFSLHYIVAEPFAVSYLNLLSVVFIGITFVNVVAKQMRLVHVGNRTFLTLLALLFLALIWALFSTHPLRNAFGLWTSRLLQPCLVGYCLYLSYVNGVVTLRQVLTSLLVSLGALVCVGALQVAHVIPTNDPGRLTAFYDFTNSFARFITMILLLTLPWLVFSPQDKGRLWLKIVWILGVLLLLGTKSYGATLAFVIGIIALFVMLPAEFRRLKLWVLAALAVVLLLVGLNASKLPKYQITTHDSVASRLEYWGIARGVIRDHLWTGIGIKTWETTYPQLVEKYGHIPPLNWVSPQPHNVYLDSLVKAGVLGLIGIIGFLLWPVIAGYQLLTRKNPEWWFGLGVFAFGVAMLAFGLVDDPLWSDDSSLMFFLVAFLVAGALHLHANAKARAE
jgi:O-antigen ligase